MYVLYDVDYLIYLIADQINSFKKCAALAWMQHEISKVTSS